MGKFTDLRLEVIDDKPDWFRVAESFWYFKGEFTYLVEKGFETDLASIPFFLRSFFSRTGKSRKPAVVHDHSYGCKYATRKECDELFLEMLLVQGIPEWKANLYYWGVRSMGWTRGQW